MVFVFAKIGVKKMNYFSKNLVKNAKFENRIRLTCSYNNCKCEMVQGRIIRIDKTNISFIEPHRIIVNLKKCKLLVIYYDENNMFLYDRRMPINMKQLDTLLKSIKGKVL